MTTVNGITIDTSDLKRLSEIFEHAARDAPRESEAALDRAVIKVHALAVLNAARVRDTGALMESVDYDTEILAGSSTRRVFSDVREAWFQEFGSPHTGAPNPWLTGPAYIVVPELVRDIERLGSLW